MTISLDSCSKVSIPHRKFKNRDCFGNDIIELLLFPSLIGSSKTQADGHAALSSPAFPSLIGSSKTTLQETRQRRETQVSIPHRKFKNGEI